MLLVKPGKDLNLKAEESAQINKEGTKGEVMKYPVKFLYPQGPSKRTKLPFIDVLKTRLLAEWKSPF